MRQQLPDMEFGRRMAGERDLQKSEAFNTANIGEIHNDNNGLLFLSRGAGGKGKRGIRQQLQLPNMEFCRHKAD